MTPLNAKEREKEGRLSKVPQGRQETVAEEVKTSPGSALTLTAICFMNGRRHLTQIRKIEASPRCKYSRMRTGIQEPIIKTLGKPLPVQGL